MLGKPVEHGTDSWYRILFRLIKVANNGVEGVRLQLAKICLAINRSALSQIRSDVHSCRFHIGNIYIADTAKHADVIVFVQTIAHVWSVTKARHNQWNIVQSVVLQCDN